jgi:hypothetical protein
MKEIIDRIGTSIVYLILLLILMAIVYYSNQSTLEIKTIDKCEYIITTNEVIHYQDCKYCKLGNNSFNSKRSF